MCAFLEALFNQAAETIRNEFEFDDLVNLEDLASQFRRKMTEGQTFESANPFRKKFYHEVIQKAETKFHHVKVPHSLFAAILLITVTAAFTNAG